MIPGISGKELCHHRRERCGRGYFYRGREEELLRALSWCGVHVASCFLTNNHGVMDLSRKELPSCLGLFY